MKEIADKLSKNKEKVVLIIEGKDGETKVVASLDRVIWGTQDNIIMLHGKAVKEG